jgi:hypothetical protein
MFLEVVEHRHLEIADEILKHIVTLHDASSAFYSRSQRWVFGDRRVFARLSVALFLSLASSVQGSFRMLSLVSAAECAPVQQRVRDFLCRKKLRGTFRQEFGAGGIIYLVLHSHLILYEVSVLMKIYVAS